MIALQLIINNLPKTQKMVLGFASNISPSEVVRLTNLKRTEAGLEPLSVNQKLSDAAYIKGADMINKDYWAHVAPDGTEPWAFFNSIGYKYRYAGENLARDFSNPNSAVEAWMQSTSHRENILNPKYKEIGIGVVEGDLSGSDTTIIVQFFGTTYADNTRPSIIASEEDNTKNSKNENKSKTSVNEVANLDSYTGESKNSNLSLEDNNDNLVLSSSDGKVLVSPFVTTRNTSMVVVSILVIVFLVDWLLVSKRRITRISGKSFAHIAFLGMILSIILILKAGKIV